MIMLAFERSIRAEVVTYSLVVIFGSLHTQQLRGFDKFCDDQRVIQNRSAKVDKTVAILDLLASYFSFRFLLLAKNIERMENGKIVCFLPFGWRSR
jgi:hypothetical protein